LLYFFILLYIKMSAAEVAITEPVKVDDQQPQTAAPEEHTANGTATEETEPKVNGHGVNGTAKKEVEPPKDPKEDPLGWISQQIPPAVHKVNHLILDWIQKTAVDEEDKRVPLPGKNEQVTRNQFLNFLKDGTVLAKLANKFSPGSVEPVHEGEEANTKENQTANLEGFIKFVKEKAGLPEEQVFTVEDIQEKGKAGYGPVFNTIFQLGLKAQDLFAQNGIDVDKLAQEAAQAVRFNFIQLILNFFKRARPTTGKPASAKPTTENGTTTNEAAIADKVIEETVVDEEKPGEQPPALPANPPPSEPIAAQ
jgi:hypothetical protein